MAAKPELSLHLRLHHLTEQIEMLKEDISRITRTKKIIYTGIKIYTRFKKA